MMYARNNEGFVILTCWATCAAAAAAGPLNRGNLSTGSRILYYIRRVHNKTSRVENRVHYTAVEYIHVYACCV
jgi:hypothetical protein